MPTHLILLLLLSHVPIVLDTFAAKVDASNTYKRNILSYTSPIYLLDNLRRHPHHECLLMNHAMSGSQAPFRLILHHLRHLHLHLLYKMPMLTWGSKTCILIGTTFRLTPAKNQKKTRHLLNSAAAFLILDMFLMLIIPSSTVCQVFSKQE